MTLRSDSGERGKSARVTLGCERSGQPDMRIHRKEIKNKDRRQTTGTKKCGCPFRLMGKKKRGTDDDWELKVVVGVHNHAVGDLEKGHSFAGRLSQEEKSLVKDRTERSEQPQEILKTLKRNDEHNNSTLRTIYNVRQLWKAESNRFDMQQWMSRLSKLSKYNHIPWKRSCPKTDTRDFFFTHPTSLDLLRSFPCVLKISAVKLFDRACELFIIGVTSTSMIFSIAYAYLYSEGRENFLWASRKLLGVMDGSGKPVIVTCNAPWGLMKALEDVFGKTQVLINRHFLYWTVEQYCGRRPFDLNDRWEDFFRKWKILVESPTIAEFERERKQLLIDFRMYPEALQFLTNSWLDPFKEKFVAAWTNKHMHFGTLTPDGEERLVLEPNFNLGSI